MTRFLFLGLSLCLANTVNSQQTDPLFQSDTLLELSFTGPFAQIDRDRDKDKEYTGTMSFRDESGQEIVFDVSYQARGNYRLRKGNCSHAQLWVDLKRGQTRDTLFENQNRLKLVVQCNNRNQTREHLVKELLAYKLFAELTNMHFGSRLLNVRYIEQETLKEDRVNLAFFIEHKNRVAAKTMMKQVDLSEIARQDLDPYQSTLVSLFMFFLGNTDYSLIQGDPGEECCHNAILLTDEDGRYFPIPYDFDASGFVDAGYAPSPDPAFGIKDNRDRVFRGFCVPNEVFVEVADRFLSSESAFASILTDNPYLGARTARRNSGYAEEFFEIIKDPQRFKRVVADRCRG